MKDSKIEWCDHTFNPWEGCTKVSAGCANCYAEARNHRFGNDNWGKGKPRRRTSEANWKQPLRWNKQLEQHNRTHGDNQRLRVFCASLADWLDDEVPSQWLADLLDLICHTPALDWLLLTKRPANWRNRIDAACTDHYINPGICGPSKMLVDWLGGEAPRNVWIGTTIENQKDERIRDLQEIPAKVRFLSCEPMLSEIQLRSPEKIHWVICGCESGPKRRPMELEWAVSLKEQCDAAGVAFFMKQMEVNGRVTGDIDKFLEKLRVREFPTEVFE